MMFFNALNDFRKLCSNQPAQCATACRVYMDIILDKKYCHVNKCYDSSVDVFYIKAESVSKGKVIILPSLITQELNLNTIHKLRSKEDGCSFLLALCDTSSNILYYQQQEEWTT